MLRFLDCEIYCFELHSLKRNELDAYFANGHQKDMVCVLDGGTYVGNITYKSLKENVDICKCLHEDGLILNEEIWLKSKKIFTQNPRTEIVPVLNKKLQPICFAWQDKEANRELRMLHELEMLQDAKTFCDLYPDYDSVTIHGCNELAYYFAKYLLDIGLFVNLDGNFWGELNLCESNGASLLHPGFEIWAEGVHQKSSNWKQERLRSASVEFECINEIYEANIKAGKITDAEGNYHELVNRLRGKDVVIRGTGTKAQDAFEWLLYQKIDICAFQSNRRDEDRKSLFGVPIMRKEEVAERFKSTVIIECGSKHSSWGFADVDTYDYEGYKRNEQYLLLRDYIEVPQNNLMYVLQRKRILLVGDIRLCSRVYKWLKQSRIIGEGILYWDILKESVIESRSNFQIPVKDDDLVINENDIYLLVVPKYSYTGDGYLAKEIKEKCDLYREAFRFHGIDDYTDYFSDMEKSIYLNSVTSKYRTQILRPAGIVLGATAAMSGNILVRQGLEGHPQIIMIDEYCFLNNDLYTICIRLAEEKSENILASFWKLYQEEAADQSISWMFVDKDKFCRKMRELLNLQNYFTSQELFVIFHLAYAAMHGKESDNLSNTIIYWEPHMWSRELVRDFAYWLDSEEIHGFTLSLVRNRYIRAGSGIRTLAKLEWIKCMNCMYSQDRKRGKQFVHWEERVIRFEDLKCKPREMLIALCAWLQIPFHDILMKTTRHGQEIYYDDSITGYDIKPAYNLYEQYFNTFDRMRICLSAASFQKQYGYPYVSCMDFSRRELQEMFLKDFCWEMFPEALQGKEEEGFWNMQKRIRYLLWMERFAEKMQVELEEEY